MIISADIGGTKTSIGLSSVNDPINYQRKTTYLNEEFNSFGEIVAHFSSKEEIDIMVLGIAGPIKSRLVQLTNLHWSIDADQLSKDFECEVHLLNDLQAAAYSIPHLEGNFIEIVYEPEQPTESDIDVIVATGTGLGVAKILHGENKRVFASEGGHIGFSPKSQFQQRFFDFIQERNLHVSCEMMVSSIGFKNLKDFVLMTDFFEFSSNFRVDFKEASNLPRFLTSVISDSDSNYDLSDISLTKKILNEFSLMTGSFLGDISLVHLPRRIYLTGGLGRNITVPEKLKQAFLEKANMSHVVQNISLSIISDPDVGLHGTSWFARDELL